jgi:hypothetical protein
MGRKRIPPSIIREHFGFAALDPNPPPATCASCVKARILLAPDGRCAVCRSTGKAAPPAIDGSSS